MEKNSLGIGDRSSPEGVAQLRARQQAEALGVSLVPVLNKSNREHTIIGTSAVDTRREADEAVATCGRRHSYYVDADHIGLRTIDRFLGSSNFFMIDVADQIGKPAVKELGLPSNLKLSVHSGSDKFSLYPIICRDSQRRGRYSAENRRNDVAGRDHRTV